MSRMPLPLILIGIAALCFASAISASSIDDPARPTWWEHVDLMQVLIGGLFCLVLWFMVRTLRKIDTNQALLFRRLDDLCKEFYVLQGEHNARKKECGQ
jgi:hypothetical protein